VGYPQAPFSFVSTLASPASKKPVLVRVLRPTRLPTDDEVVASIVEFYKEAIPTEATDKLDTYTRAEFQFSGLEGRVIGTFYRGPSGDTIFAGDLENFYAPNNYQVFKPSGRALEYIVNYRSEGLPGGVGDERVGAVRYSSALRQAADEAVPVYVSAFDFLGKRTALFGMTRTGKSNTVKKIIQATVDISTARPHMADGPLRPVGQIIFDGKRRVRERKPAGPGHRPLYAVSEDRHPL